MTNDTTKITITLTTEQRLRLEKLRSTTMSGERSDNPKTLEEQNYAAIEKGLYSLEYGRKQYQEKQLGAKLYKAMKDEKFRGEQAQAISSMLETLGVTRKVNGAEAGVRVIDSND